jgi:hypothetical protein
MPSPVDIYFKRSFKAEYKNLPPTIRALFDAACEKLEEGTLTLHQQGWMHYIIVNDVYMAWGMYVKDPDGFKWNSIGTVDKLPMIL